MKRFVILAVALVATFAVSMKMHSSSKSVKPSGYCKYDEKKGLCSMNSDGWVCYSGINEDCSWKN